MGLAVIAALAALVWLWQDRGGTAEPDDPIGLFTTLPILWAESADLGELVSARTEPHWARGVLADRGQIAPLDDLADPKRLKGLHDLALAQPRPLSPQENVALDRWVREGGRLILFADPMLTEESNFALGDPRRPQGTVLLSPILGRWGLTLAYDEAQAFGERQATAFGEALPVNLAGHFEMKGEGPCRIDSGELAAECAIGQGRVVVVADAALLERVPDPESRFGIEARSHLLARLLDRAFAGR